jgi:hypothetical protein
MLTRNSAVSMQCRWNVCSRFWCAAYALGALHAGADAHEAMEIAAKMYSVYCWSVLFKKYKPSTL